MRILVVVGVVVLVAVLVGRAHPPSRHAGCTDPAGGGATTRRHNSTAPTSRADRRLAGGGVHLGDLQHVCRDRGPGLGARQRRRGGVRGRRSREHAGPAPSLPASRRCRSSRSPTAEGVVQRSFVGPVSATHLWAAVAEVREPGSVTAGLRSDDPRTILTDAVPGTERCWPRDR